MSWQPIQTAPRDGTWIIVAVRSTSERRDIDIAIASWQETHSYYAVDGYSWCYQGFDDYSSLQTKEPTHWMHLPPLPPEPPT